MKKINLTPEERTLTLDVYAGNGEVNIEGYHRGNGQAVYFIHECYIWQSIGSSRKIVEELIADLERDVENYANLDTIAFDFDVTSAARAFFLGNKIQLKRNPLFSSAVCLRPVTQRRRETLTREIKRIGTVQDVRGRRLTLVA